MNANENHVNNVSRQSLNRSHYNKSEASFRSRLLPKIKAEMRDAEHYESFRFHMKRFWIFLENLRYISSRCREIFSFRKSKWTKSKRRLRGKRKTMRTATRPHFPILVNVLELPSYSLAIFRLNFELFISLCEKRQIFSMRSFLCLETDRDCLFSSREGRFWLNDQTEKERKLKDELSHRPQTRK